MNPLLYSNGKWVPSPNNQEVISKDYFLTNINVDYQIDTDT